MARPRKYVPFNGRQSRADGITVSVSDGCGHARVLVRQGMAFDAALREIAWQLDEWPGDWRIDAISTPRTIYRDLSGTRGRNTRGGRPRDDGLPNVSTEPPESYVQRPEREMLGRIGRGDLLRAT